MGFAVGSLLILIRRGSGVQCTEKVTKTVARNSLTILFLNPKFYTSSSCFMFSSFLLIAFITFSSTVPLATSTFCRASDLAPLR